MITAEELKRIFRIPNDIKGSRIELYEGMKYDERSLYELGHNLWPKPVNYIADFIVILDRLDPFFHKRAILELYVFLHQLPKFDGYMLDKSIEEWNKFLSQEVKTFINSSEANKKLVDDIKDPGDFTDMKEDIDDLLHYYMITLRHVLAERIIAAAKNSRPQEMREHDHPIWKLYKPEDISGGDIGDGKDLQFSKSLVSSNDISGLLVKLKTVYMKAAYLQLIQTLSQLAEKKAYKTITFRQDELKEVLAQVKQLSDDTFKQLKIEDQIISKLCYNIIKTVDPSADLTKTMEALSLDLGPYPSYNYTVVNHSY